MGQTVDSITYSLASSAWLVLVLGAVALAGPIAVNAFVGAPIDGGIYFGLAVFICSLVGYRRMSRSRLEIDADGLCIQSPLIDGLRFTWCDLERIERMNPITFGDVILIRPRSDIDWRQRLPRFARLGLWFNRIVRKADGLMIGRTELGDRYDEAFTTLMAHFDRSRRDEAPKS